MEDIFASVIIVLAFIVFFYFLHIDTQTNFN